MDRITNEQREAIVRKAVAERDALLAAPAAAVQPVALPRSDLEQAVQALEGIASATDPDSAEENYRADDREGCLDYVFATARAALTALRAHLKPDIEVHRAAPQTEAASVVQADAIPLTRLDALARVYAASYASPHHFTMGVEGLRNLIDALKEPTK